MSKTDAYSFIKYYSRFYFDDSENLISKEEFETAGVPKNLKTTNRDLETYIEDKLKNGYFDAEAFAWKAGKAKWENGHFDYVPPFPGKLVIGNRFPIKLNKDAKAFTREDFEKHVNDNPVDVEGYNFNLAEDRKNLFLKIKDCYSLINYGTVYIINQMFYLSKGSIPIYDQFAHAAVKALLMHKSPLEVFVSSAPSKNDPPKGEDNYYPATNILEEYMWLLNEVFPGEIHKDGEMYISRELDQALWVYGHVTKRWPFEEGK